LGEVWGGGVQKEDDPWTRVRGKGCREVVKEVQKESSKDLLPHSEKRHPDGKGRKGPSWERQRGG